MEKEETTPSTQANAKQSFTKAQTILSVVSRYHPDELSWHANGEPILSSEDKRSDGWDEFNHPRYRRAMILKELAKRNDIDYLNNDTEDICGRIVFYTPVETKSTTGINDNVNNNSDLLQQSAYNKVHSAGLLRFLDTAWKKWKDMTLNGQSDPSSSLKYNLHDDNDECDVSPTLIILPLIPGNVPLPRIAADGQQQRPSKNVMGQVGYYCTDNCTPILENLSQDELVLDLETVKIAVDLVTKKQTTSATACPLISYALCTHPGHHAAHDSFGGYCYLNHAALAARLLQERLRRNDDPTSTDLTHQVSSPLVAILDIDYHCGNGTASIFYEDPSVFVVSIHCHPDYEYPFHSGFEDDRGGGAGEGATLHLPLLPGTTWESSYKATLDRALEEILAFGDDGVAAVVLSLGLDTHSGDPCAVRRAGFQLEGNDYSEMGEFIGERLGSDSMCTGADANDCRIPIVVIQEGGYKMDKVPAAAADVLLGIAEQHACT